MNNQIIANHPRLSVLIYFICTDMNNQMIENHLRLYILISYKFTDTSNWMITNHPRISANDKHIIQKARLVSLSCVYSPI